MHHVHGLFENTHMSIISTGKAGIIIICANGAVHLQRNHKGQLWPTVSSKGHGSTMATIRIYGF